ncbi:PepSY domain-containing protein [Halobacillus litoralis]|uniref:PepSY domain-containing protein n=1 Tax=Halobacillus litoralis TaxID=45668 RepID=UPI002490438F|nr:PepSY domain-containing protein [Halobacillus litoralis]
MMKKKLMIAGITGVVTLGGAFGVSAVAGDNQWKSEEVKVSQKEAESIATDEVKKLTINKVEKDNDDNQYYYEIDGKTEDGKEVEVDVDAMTGEVIKVDRDEEEKSDDDSDQQAAENLKVPKEEAEKIAKEKSAGEIVEVEVDDGNYEIELKDDTHEYDVTVNGQTGEVIESEKEKE